MNTRRGLVAHEVAPRQLSDLETAELRTMEGH